MKKLAISVFSIFYFFIYTEAQISITNFATPYTQNFDSLSSDSTWANTHAMNIAGWTIFEKGTGAAADQMYKVNHGSRNNGETYSYGAINSSDRALGSIASGTNVPSFGVTFENNTGSDIATVNVSYVGEQWRSGDAAATTQDSTIFEYSITATGINDSNNVWTEVSTLMLNTPNPTATTGATDGNDASFKVNVSGSFNVTVPNGSKLYIRWRDINKAGTDDGLAIDDLTIGFVPLSNDKPLILNLLPTDGSISVDIATTVLKAKFDRNIAIGSGSAKVKNITDNTTQTIGAGNCSVAGTDTLVISTVSLVLNKDYAVMFDSTLVTANGFNSYGIYDETSWNFDTKQPNAVNDYSINKLPLSIYNNSDYLFVSFEILQTQSLQLEILDASGKVILRNNATLNSGNQKLQIPINGLSQGMYFIKVIGNQVQGVSQFVK